MSVLGIIQTLRDTPSKNAKIALLKAHDSYDLRCVLDATYNTFHTYGLQKLPFRAMPSYASTLGQGLPDLLNLLAHLKQRNYTGQNAVNACFDFIYNAGADMEELLRLVLARDLDCGVQTSTVNKAFPGLIPTFDCQLAVSAEKAGLTFPIWAEEKFDGVRILAFVKPNGVELYSREGQRHVIPLIEEQIAGLRNVMGYVLDGEMVGENRQKVSGLMSKFRLGTAAPEEAHKLHFHVFDCFRIDEFNSKHCEVPYSQRRLMLNLIMSATPAAAELGTLNVHAVTSELCTDREAVDRLYAEVTERGGEGLIIKTSESTYDFKRTASWVKMKGIHECDLRVIGTNAGEGKRAGGIGSLICATDDGKVVVNVGGGFSEKMLKWLNINQHTNLIGKIVVIRYNMMCLEEGAAAWSLFLPRFVEFRDDKSVTDKFEDITKGF